MSKINKKYSSVNNNDIEFYENNYGVSISEDENGKIELSGESRNFNKVSYDLRKNIMISENKIPVYREVKGSMSSKLLSYEEKDYNNSKDNYEKLVFTV